MATPDKIRSATLLGAQGSGKSALAEALLYRAGAIHHVEGGRALDIEPEEVKRQSTVFSKIQALTWEKHEIFIADTAGAADFIGGTIAPLAALDAAVVVVDATGRVEVSTRKLFSLAVSHKKPILFFINKMDKELADYDRALESIRNTLTKRAYPVSLPIGQGADLRGAIDLLGACAFFYADGKVQRGEVPESEKDRFEQARTALIEEVAGTDEELFEKVASGQELGKDEILPYLLKNIREGELYPVLVGSANPPMGTTLLLDALTRLLVPSTDLPELEATNESDGSAIQLKRGPGEPTVAQIFKIFSDPGIGDIFFLKVVAGTVKHGEDLINTRSRERERLGHLFYFRGKERSEVPEAPAGSVIAVAKLKGSLVGDTLSASERLVTLPPISFPNTVHSVSVHPKTRKDQDKLGIALSKLASVDPTLNYYIDPEFNETILSGMGEVHLEVVAGRLKDRYGIDITTGRPHVAYRETLTKKIESQGRHKKQTGGHGQFGDVWIRVEPLPIGTGFEFSDEIKGGVIPNKFIPSVETGVREAMKKGQLAGFPVVDVKVTLYDGSYHTVDSSDIAFQLAGALAFRKCQEKAGAVLLEPIMRLEVTVPSDYVGAITNHLSSHRGRILGMDGSGELQSVRAEVPQAELFSYSTELRSITQGAGSYTMGFAQYEPLPSHLVAQVQESLKAAREKIE
ncbi:MAG TPA: elongation factor G [Polyangiaceae bacterium]